MFLSVRTFAMPSICARQNGMPQPLLWHLHADLPLTHMRRGRASASGALRIPLHYAPKSALTSPCASLANLFDD